MAAVKRGRVVVDTDVLVDHLVTVRHPSVLRKTMRKQFCYATVYSAIQLFSAAETGREVREVERMLGALKILGVNGKSGKNIGRLLRHTGRLRGPGVDQLIAGLCVESGLPLLTMRPKRFSGIRRLRVISAGRR